MLTAGGGTRSCEQSAYARAFLLPLSSERMLPGIRNPPYAFRAGLKKQPLNNCMSEGKNNAAEPAALQLTPGRADLV